ncbi:phosphate ABC transporter substrate-binding protein PstS [soil metagenome]
MKLTSARRGIVPGIAVLALALTACGADNEDTGSGSDGSGSEGSSVSGTLSGGGASTQQAAMGAWAVGFQDANPGATINYDPVGSGGGREGFVSGGFPFAGSDDPLEGDELAAAQDNCGGDVIEIPDYVSPIALVYNLPGVDGLNLAPDTIAGIFAGQITSWDDAAIAADNPDADLPSSPINPVHRSDESGTTGNFTDYLTAVSPDTWDVGVIEEWPKQYGGEGAAQTSGVVQAVTNGENSIGYADASQAAGLQVANVGVGDDFVEPSAEAAAKILDASTLQDGRSDTDLAYDLDRTTAEAGTYPVVLTSYLLLCPTYADQETADLVKAFAGYVVSADGQEQAAGEAGSAPLSSELQDKAASIIDGITAG